MEERRLAWTSSAQVPSHHGYQGIDKGMPIEQVQVLLGHSKIDTTLCYAMVDQQKRKTFSLQIYKLETNPDLTGNGLGFRMPSKKFLVE